MKYHAWFACTTEGCSETYPLNEVIYKCRKCGKDDKRSGLLEVRHDLGALRESRSPDQWKKLFDRRYLRNLYPYGSGVWGKKEWVCPNVTNENVVSIFEGGSNCFWAERFGKEIGLNDLWIKLCGNSHSGSFKDLGMTVLVSMVNQMIHEGTNLRAVVCASTGDTSASLAAYCATAGIPAVVILPKDRVSIPQLIQPIANGALTLALDTDFDGCMKIVTQISRDKRYYIANSFNSLRLEGQKTISIELSQQFDWEPVDWVIVPGGNLGNVSAIGKGFLMMKDLGLIDHLPRLVCAQAHNANPLFRLFQQGLPEGEFRPQKAKPTLANAIQIGDPVNLNKALRTLKKIPGGLVEECTENELANAAAWVDRFGLFNCPHTAVALSALLKLVNRGEIKSTDRVIVISTASGLKFPDFKIGYHTRQLTGVAPRHANEFLPLPPKFENVMDALEEHVGK
ncbi:MAG: threonine synthase [Armatimonadetes bacterium]|nr:threonine synthase [Armatimonadota bacterium]